MTDGQANTGQQLLREHGRPSPPHLEITEAMIERGAVALVNSDGTESHDRRDGRWRPAVLAEAVLRAALSEPDLQPTSE